jgi:5'-nucleotidase
MGWVTEPPRIRPIIGVDLDGVLCDYVAGLRSFLSHRRHEEIPDAHSFRLTEWFASDDERVSAHSEAVREGLWQTAPPVAGAVQGIQLLQGAGWEVAAVTARGSYGEGRAAVEDTAMWLERNSLTLAGLWVGRPKIDSGCALFIDDSPSELARYASAGIRFAVFDQPWNRHVAGPRLRSWSAVLSIVGTAGSEMKHVGNSPHSDARD